MQSARRFCCCCVALVLLFWASREVAAAGSETGSTVFSMLGELKTTLDTWKAKKESGVFQKLGELSRMLDDWKAKVRLNPSLDRMKPAGYNTVHRMSVSAHADVRDSRGVTLPEGSLEYVTADGLAHSLSGDLACNGHGVVYTSPINQICLCHPPYYGVACQSYHVNKLIEGYEALSRMSLNFYYDSMRLGLVAQPRSSTRCTNGPAVALKAPSDDPASTHPDIPNSS
eukprot:gnl/Hemi2/21356_TR7107_c0_g1_i1.p1 gnl/Hemi2/21356_TR7107_c0_g1~~gnl/Hemi2/21356_TR7107_c0_g1_i1.p1  ORF type:complete len:228 (-),score=10.94 gnl/Hemi2/21356_TR7107_c0_g1_i1:75-758(-)